MQWCKNYLENSLNFYETLKKTILGYETLKDPLTGPIGLVQERWPNDFPIGLVL